MDCPTARLCSCHRWRAYRMVTDRPGTGWQTSFIHRPVIDFSSEVSAWYGSSQGRPATDSYQAISLEREMQVETVLLSRTDPGMWYVLCRFDITATGNRIKGSEGSLFRLTTMLSLCLFESLEQSETCLSILKCNFSAKSPIAWQSSS